MLNPVAPAYSAAIADCADQDALTVARVALLALHALLDELRARASNGAVAERLETLTATLDEETRSLVCLSVRCAEQEEADQRDWFAVGMATYHDSNR